MNIPRTFVDSSTCQVKPEAQAGVYLHHERGGGRVPHPYHAYNSAYNPVSRQDSDISSEAHTTDDNMSSFTESSSHYSNHYRSAAKPPQFDLTYLYFKQAIFRLFLLDFKARQYPCRASEKILCKNVSFSIDPLLSSATLNLQNHQGSGSPLMCSTKPVFKGGECTLAV